MDLVHDPIPGLVRRIALPASLGYFFNTLFNLVDTWYAGWLSTDALAALSLSFPAFFTIIAFSAGMSSGVSALVANALGGGREEEARTVATQALVLTLAAGLILSAAGVAGSAWFFRLVGATGEVHAMATRYMQVIFGGSLFFALTQVLNASLIARGDTVSYRNILLGGVVLNLVLDPWFMFGGFGLPAFGFSGIAVSTVLIHAGAAAYIGSKVFPPGLVRIRNLRDLLPQPGVLRDIVRQSGPSTLHMATVGIGIFVLTFFVNRFGPEAVAAYGIATRIEQIALLPTIGLNLAVLSLVGQNHGAGRADRIRDILTISLRAARWILGIGGLVILVWAPGLVGLFTRDPVVIRIGADYLRIAAFLLYGYAVIFIMTAGLQGVKRPVYSIWMGLYRQVAAPLLLIPALLAWTPLGLYGIWISVAFTTVTAAWLTARYLYRQLDR